MGRPGGHRVLPPSQVARVPLDEADERNGIGDCLTPQTNTEGRETARCQQPRYARSGCPVGTLRFDKSYKERWLAVVEQINRHCVGRGADAFAAQ